VADDFGIIRCPTCKAEVARGSPQFPFCSKRCRYVDLGAWLEERYRIPSGPPEDDQDLADAPPADAPPADERSDEEDHDEN